MSTPTDNIILLAAEGFKFARRVGKGPFAGQYVGLPGKSGATHKIHCTRPKPRYDPKHAPRGMVRIIYHDNDPKAAVDFPNTFEGRLDAAARLTTWCELAKNASPTSAVAVPRGRSYKHFCAERAKAAADGTLYGTKNKEPNMTQKKKPAPPTKTKKTSTPKDQKNGITRPKDGTVTGRVWDLCDKHKGERAAVIAEGTTRKINLATITTQHGKWRKYHGIEGRTAKPKAAKVTKKKPSAPKKKPAPPAAPAAV